MLSIRKLLRSECFTTETRDRGKKIEMNRNKVAVITGGAGGIGESTARLFSKHGARVIIADIRDHLGKSVCMDLGPETASFVHCDVSIESDVENAIVTAVDKYGKLDIMVNDAAICDPPKANILDNDKADFERVVSVNLTGVFLGTKRAAQAMIPSQRGSIINLGSISSSVGGIATHAYTSSKHAIVGLTRNVAAELGRYGIREDVAEAALFLGSDESKYISGHNLAVDGGFTTINPAFGLFARA
ncbi:hypothetical protein BT93_L2226 [Corymbia citriodora subsp. variegata]|uniref:Uncharacterized protein n=1 Tax=Corymbia citriodora subsp. variegata TaxID=360336 RepID=A0A8T0CN02_CORYI|nr:hypothetical protein BT93_L2226 [Corymbia citriodora subsp. variegata]